MAIMSLQPTIYLCDVIAGIDTAILVEDYPNYHRGPTILVRQFDAKVILSTLFGVFRQALREGDLETAARLARVFELTPIAA